MNLEPRAIAVRREGGTVSIDIALAADHPLLRGHFPEQPILPGVAQLQWAIKSARAHFAVRSAFLSAHALKFSGVIVPKAPLHLEIAADPDQGSDLEFSYRQQNHVCSSGRLRFGDA